MNIEKDLNYDITILTHIYIYLYKTWAWNCWLRLKSLRKKHMRLATSLSLEFQIWIKKQKKQSSSIAGIRPLQKLESRSHTEWKIRTTWKSNSKRIKLLSSSHWNLEVSIIWSWTCIEKLWQLEQKKYIDSKTLKSWWRRNNKISHGLR